MKFNNLKFEVKDEIAYITINRPSKLNAINFDTLKDINNAVREVHDNNTIKGAIITGEGDKSFVAGADINEIASLNEINGRKASENGQEIFNMIEDCPKPIIAAINGYALGGGLELAMACHMRIATKEARFGQPEIGLGIIPAYGGTQRLTQLVGKGKAIELLLTGDPIDADEAYRIGLVNHVVNKSALLPKCEEILGKIIKKAPLAAGMIIQCVNDNFSVENGYQSEANSFGHCCGSDDFKEGTNAFLEKRAPKFKGK